MSDNGQPFVVWMPGMLTLFGKRLRDLHIQHLRMQISSPWTNVKIEAFRDILQAEWDITGSWGSSGSWRG